MSMYVRCPSCWNEIDRPHIDTMREDANAEPFGYTHVGLCPKTGRVLLWRAPRSGGCALFEDALLAANMREAARG